jgi:hypothetical protein
LGRDIGTSAAVLVRHGARSPDPFTSTSKMNVAVAVKAHAQVHDHAHVHDHATITSISTIAVADTPAHARCATTGAER